MEAKYDVHGHKKIISRWLELATMRQVGEKVGHGKTPTANPNLTDEDITDIKNFYNYFVRKGRSDACISRYLYRIKMLYFLAGKSIRGMKQADMENLVSKIQTMDCSQSNKCEYMLILRKYYKWLKDPQDRKLKTWLPKEVSWIQQGNKGQKKKLPEELLTEQEILRIAENTKNPMEKAFILGLYESGTRIAEWMTLQTRNIEFDEFGAVLMVTGKTGDRRVRIVASVPALKNWLELHPVKHPDSYVWVRVSAKKADRPFTYEWSKYLIKEAARKAGVNKRIYPHLFRHSRATILAGKLNEYQLRQFFGWTMTSDTPATYIHRSGKDLDKDILKVNGIILEKEDVPEIAIKVCEKCQTHNDPVAIFCSKCRFPIDANEKRRIVDSVVIELIGKLAQNNPMVQATLRNIVVEKGLENLFKQ